MPIRHSIFLLLVVFLFTACDSSREAGRPGNVAVGNDFGYGENSGGIGDSTGVTYGGGSIFSNSMPELSPGTQEDLVANVGDRVFFNFNSADLSADAQKTLTRQAEWLTANSGASVIIEGHCDERGTREYNLALGERRAVSVKNYLVSLGIAPNRISTISYGKEHPEYLDKTEVAWSKNRRSVTVINR